MNRPSPHRRRRRSPIPLSRLGIVLAAGAVILGAGAIVQLHRAGSEPSRYVVTEKISVHPPQSIAREGELARCRSQQLADDERCRMLWEEQRERFFGNRR